LQLHLPSGIGSHSPFVTDQIPLAGQVARWGVPEAQLAE
jgi:hypothetical protein